MKAAETVQKQYSEYQKFSVKEVEKLNAKIKELTNSTNTRQRDYERKIKDVSIHSYSNASTSDALPYV